MPRAAAGKIGLPRGENRPRPAVSLRPGAFFCYTSDMKTVILVIGAFILLLLINAYATGNLVG